MSDSQTEKLWNLHRRVLVSLIKGKSYPEIRKEYLDEMTGLNYEEILAKAGNISFDEDHHLVGAYPICPNPSRYRVDVDGIGSGYAMCAVDAIGVAFTFDRTTTVRAKDMSTGEEIKMVVTPDMTTSPGYNWWMTYKTTCEPGEITALAQCPAINFHSDKEGIKLGKDMIIMDDKESYEYARERFHYTTLKSRIEDVLKTGKTISVI